MQKNFCHTSHKASILRELLQPHYSLHREFVVWNAAPFRVFAMKTATMSWLTWNCSVWTSLAGFSLYRKLNTPKIESNGFSTTANSLVDLNGPKNLLYSVSLLVS